MRPVLTIALASLGCAGPLGPERTQKSAAEVATDPLMRCAGRWFHRGPETILGRSVDEVLRIERGASGWTMRIDSVLNPGVHPRNDEARARHLGATVPLALDGDRFVYPTAVHYDDVLHEVRRTFRQDGERLYFPAWVRRGEQEWAFSGPREEYLIRTEHDPLEVAAGAVTSTGLAVWPTPITYTASREADPLRPGAEQRVLRFEQRAPDGAAVDLGRLVEHSEWGRALFRFDTCGEQLWTRLSDAEWALIESLPVRSRADGQ